jgi:hypothetical protein
MSPLEVKTSSTFLITKAMASSVYIKCQRDPEAGYRATHLFIHMLTYGVNVGAPVPEIRRENRRMQCKPGMI